VEEESRAEKTREDHIVTANGHDYLIDIETNWEQMFAEMAAKDVIDPAGLVSKITLDQYEHLVGRGYDGDVVRRWTQHHAAQVLASGSRCTARLRQFQKGLIRSMAEMKYRASNASRDTLPLCPHCKTPVREDRMAKHIKKIHPEN
jgi:hypothetical protein